MSNTVRAHSKSRRGCLRCKRRKVKCDEVRPRCTACIRRDDDCVYPSPFAASNGGTGGEDDTTSSSSDPSKSRSPDSGPLSTFASLIKSETVLAGQHSPVDPSNQYDLRLLWHYVRRATENYSNDPTVAEIWQDDFVQEALQHPFLMETLLSMSALHLQIHGDRTANWPLVAELKKSRALKGYISALSQVTDDNVLAAFCCSTLLPVTFLASSMPTHESTATYSEAVLLAVCTLFRLQCGCGAVMKTFKSDRLWTSRICKMMTRAANVQPGELPQDTTEMLAQIRSILEEPRYRQTDYGDLFLSAADHLERCLRLLSHDGRDLDIDSEHVFGWPVLCGELFVEALANKEPPALALLACYGAVYHHMRRLWFIGDWGQHIVRATSLLIDPTWNIAVTWARRRVEM